MLAEQESVVCWLVRRLRQDDPVPFRQCLKPDKRPPSKSVHVRNPHPYAAIQLQPSAAGNMRKGLS